MSERVSLLVFEDVELLDFAGPFEMLAAANEVSGKQLYEISLIGAGETAAAPLYKSYAGPKFAADKLLSQHPRENWDAVILIPGGTGTRRMAGDQNVIDWLRAAHRSGTTVASICTGARILAAAGLLAGKPFTTHHETFDDLAKREPTGIIDRTSKVVDLGSVLTSGGVSSGMDLALHLIRRSHGETLAWRVADYVEYRWRIELVRVV